MTRPTHRSWSTCLVACFALAVVTSELGLRLLQDQALHTSVWWPLAGAGLALMVRLPRGYWLPVIAGIDSGQFLSALGHGYGLTSSAAIALATAGELIAIATLLGRVFPGGARLDTPRHAAGFTGCVVAGVVLGSTVYAVPQTLWGNGDLLALWAGCFSAHALGMLLVSPVFLVATYDEARDELRERRANLEWLAQFVVVGALGAVMFATRQQLVPSVVCSLPLLWGGLRLGALRSMVSLQLLAVVATVGTLHGGGPFADTGWARTPTTQMALASLTLLLLFSVLAARAKNEALRLSEDRAAALTKAEELTGTGSGMLDLKTGQVTWTPGVYRHLGLDPATVAPDPQHYFAAIHPDDRERVMNTVREMMATGETRIGHEYRLMHPDGSQRLVVGRTEPETDDSGRVVRLHSTVHDITALRETQAARARSDSELAAVLEALTETAVLTTSAVTGIVTRFNRGAERLLGWEAGEAIGSARPSTFLTPETRRAIANRLGTDDQALAFEAMSRRPGKSVTEQTICVRKDGTRFPAQLTITTHVAPDGSREFIGVITDLTEVMRAQAELGESQDRFRRAFEGAPLAMAIVGLDPIDPGVINRVNQALSEFVGRPATALLGRRIADLTAEPSATRITELLVRMADGEIHEARDDIQLLECGDGEKWGRMAASAVRPSGDTAAYLIVMIEDITARRELTERLHHEATHDALTGLPNRSHLHRELDRTLRQQVRPVAVLYIDLDGFKAVNDTAGHAAGDALLKQAADRIAACVRADDVVARLGGDEFAVLCPGIADADIALEVARRIVASIGEEFDLTLARVRIGASVGVALSTTDDTGPALLHAADEAMYRAKRGGKGRVRVSSR
ncbi:sensor domain-containing diguanylate cyclase [Kineosporia sp. NBRC 101731]|uniref:sensor domain-containing diguanylate cyclase n=1 Tax=Kineosporia sp. NBRC 101731 TaxID=3032199 RepID=UPI0024A2E6FB|nr:sensor domain-containing diguanylate cyclase [Kineosporia sp. NBRC 101731]GLY31804.1 hypothetical protein Kisp02_51690 [Kineosporia sp. NBRC 101731]